MTDERLARLVAIEGFGRQQRHVIAVQVGGPDSRLNAMVREVATAASAFRRTAAEVRGHSKLLPSEVGQRITEASAPLINRLKAASAVYAEESARIQRQAKTATAVEGYGPTTHFADALADSRMADRLFSMGPTDRATLIHLATNDSGSLRWAQCLLRQPIEVSGLSPAERDAMRLGVLSRLRPDVHAAIESEREQAAQAERALQIAMSVLAEEAPGSATEVRAAIPAPAEAEA